jgi:hypothetical protein
MKFLTQWLKENGDLHHAHLLIGEGILVAPELETFFTNELSFPVRGNPDYTKEEFAMFGVEDAHRIATAQLQKSIAHPRKIFVLTVGAFSSEAQNALLKMFEEPTSNTHFFIIVSSQDILFPTVRSRLLVVPMQGDFKNEANFSRAKKFVEAGIADRIKMLENIIESKSKSETLVFLDDIEAYIHKLFIKNPKDKSLISLLENIIELRGYLRDRAPSVKMILEHLAHTIPIVN